MLTEEQLKRFFNRHNIDKKFLKTFVKLLERFQNEFHLNTPERLALFLGQVKAEIGIRSDGTVRIRENLNYSTQRLMQVFPFFRKNPVLAQKYGKNKKHNANRVAIANFVYADKNRRRSHRLGNIVDGDGWIYRGIGVLQSTGRENINLDLENLYAITDIKVTDYNGNPLEELMNTYTIAILLGMSHWERKKLYLKESSMAVTNVINIGLSSRAKLAREEHTEFARSIFV